MITKYVAPVAPAHPVIDELRAELGEIELNVLTGFTLADAIRAGAGKTEQVTGSYVRGRMSCALGAAYLAARAHGYV